MRSGGAGRSWKLGLTPTSRGLTLGLLGLCGLTLGLCWWSHLILHGKIEPGSRVFYRAGAGQTDCRPVCQARKKYSGLSQQPLVRELEEATEKHWVHNMEKGADPLTAARFKATIIQQLAWRSHS